jgi:hypothetical protein
MDELAGESSLIQKLILRQLPSTDEELAIQAMHIAGLYEADQPLQLEEQQAIEIGVEQMFDYLVSEDRGDVGRLGRQFTIGASLAFDHRRYRMGQFED